MGLEKLAKTIKSEIKKQEETLAERFISELDSYLIRSRAEEYKKQEEKVGAYIRPSSYYKCMRQLWYKMKSFPCKENNTAKGIRTLEIGTSLHEWVQREIFMKPDAPFPYVPVKELSFLNREGVELFTEKQNKFENRPEMEIGWIDKRFTPNHPLYCIVDGVLNPESRYFLFEFKTINPNDFKYLYEPLDEHKKQGALYSLSSSIDNFLFLYLNKATSEWKSFEFYVTEAQKEWAHNRVVTLDTCLVNHVLPPKEVFEMPKYGKGVTNCRFCPYKEFCEKDVSECA